MKLLSTTALAAVLLAGGAAADDKGHGGNAPFASPDATWATDFDRSTLRIFRVDARGKRLPHYFRVQLRDLYEVDQSGAVQCSLGGAAAGSPGALPEDGFLSFDSIASSDFTQVSLSRYAVEGSAGIGAGGRVDRLGRVISRLDRVSFEPHFTFEPDYPRHPVCSRTAPHPQASPRARTSPAPAAT